MQTIQRWAAAHPRLSWLTLTLLHFALAFLWADIGIRLYAKGWQASETLLLSLSLLLLLAIVLYPGRWEYRSLKRQAFLRYRLGIDAFILLLSALLFISVFNQSARQAELLRPGGGMALPMVERLGTSNSLGLVKSWNSFKSKKEKRQWRKKIRRQVKERVKALRRVPGQNTGLKIFGLMLISAILSFGILLLSCSLACSGAGAAAILVAVFGVVGTVALLSGFLRKVLPEKDKAGRVGAAILIFLGGILLMVGAIAVLSG